MNTTCAAAGINRSTGTGGQIIPFPTVLPAAALPPAGQYDEVRCAQCHRRLFDSERGSLVVGRYQRVKCGRCNALNAVTGTAAGRHTIRVLAPGGGRVN